MVPLTLFVGLLLFNFPAVKFISKPKELLLLLVDKKKSDTEEIEDKASPLNPRVEIFVKFSLRILEVACLLTDNNKSSFSIPRPLSATIISFLPPPLM